MGERTSIPTEMGNDGSVAAVAKETYRIGEVATLTEIAPYVLRYWESEFPMLHPAKSPHGQRLYRHSDIETVLSIKRLLYERGFTIAGARKQLEVAGSHPSPAVAPTPTPRAPVHDPAAREQLRAVRAELKRLLTLLSRR